jgi:hypothetical protein
VNCSLINPIFNSLIHNKILPTLSTFSPYFDIFKIKEVRYRPGVAQRVPGGSNSPVTGLKWPRGFHEVKSSPVTGL